ncbi:MAG: hypothetical protein HOC74_18270 [Gemmatimonadetes bacterium]|nr:hypothetical protein [Gemmatimonadota bacterium]
MDGFVTFTAELLSHPDWDTGVPILINHRDLDQRDFNTPQIRAISNLVASRSEEFGGRRCAIVLSRDVDFGLSRMWEAMTESRITMSSRSFRSVEEAQRWLEETGMGRP